MSGYNHSYTPQQYAGMVGEPSTESPAPQEPGPYGGLVVAPHHNDSAAYASVQQQQYSYEATASPSSTTAVVPYNQQHTTELEYFLYQSKPLVELNTAITSVQSQMSEISKNLSFLNTATEEQIATLVRDGVTQQTAMQKVLALANSMESLDSRMATLTTRSDDANTALYNLLRAAQAQAQQDILDGTRKTFEAECRSLAAINDTKRQQVQQEGAISIINQNISSLSQRVNASDQFALNQSRKGLESDEKVAEVTRTITNLQGQIKSCQFQIKFLEDKAAQGEMTARTVDAVKSNLVEKINNLNNEIEGLQRNVSNKANRASLNRVEASTKNEVAKVEFSIQNIKSGFDGDLRTLHSMITSTQTKASELEDEAKKLHSELAAGKSHVTAEVSQMKTTFTRDLQQLTGRVDKVQAQAQSQEVKIAALEKAQNSFVQKADARITQLEQEVRMIKNENSELHQGLKLAVALSAEVAFLKSQLEEVRTASEQNKPARFGSQRMQGIGSFDAEAFNADERRKSSPNDESSRKKVKREPTTDDEGSDEEEGKTTSKSSVAHVSYPASKITAAAAAAKIEQWASIRGNAVYFNVTSEEITRLDAYSDTINYGIPVPDDLTPKPELAQLRTDIKKVISLINSETEESLRKKIRKVFETIAGSRMVRTESSLEFYIERGKVHELAELYVSLSQFSTRTYNGKTVDIRKTRINTHLMLRRAGMNHQESWAAFAEQALNKKSVYTDNAFHTISSQLDFDAKEVKVDKETKSGKAKGGKEKTAKDSASPAGF